jgi:hypothetical protein
MAGIIGAALPPQRPPHRRQVRLHGRPPERCAARRQRRQRIVLHVGPYMSALFE